jgi:hypothetical protein
MGFPVAMESVYSCEAFLAAKFLLARQASEQYRTEAQFFAQDLRQLILRPHTAQGLLGKDCLLPLKSVFMGIVTTFQRAEP